MGSQGFFKGEKKKMRKEDMEKKAMHIARVAQIPQVEIIGRKKGK